MQQHSIGDGIIVLAVAGAVFGYYYLKHRRAQQRLEIIHRERMAAMDKGIPLPELPIDPLPTPDPFRQDVPFILGILLFSLGSGVMLALRILPGYGEWWALPLPFALMGLGLIVYHLLASQTLDR